MKGLFIISFTLLTLLSGCISTRPTCEEVKVPYNITRCVNEVEINLKDTGAFDEHTNATECPNFLEGVSYANYGNIESSWEFVNKNDILLSLSCKIKVSKYKVDWADASKTSTISNLLAEEVVESVTINIPAQNTAILKRRVYLPKCYGSVHIDCTDTKDLVECQPITEYRTETKCD